MDCLFPNRQSQNTDVLCRYELLKGCQDIADSTIFCIKMSLRPCHLSFNIRRLTLFKYLFCVDIILIILEYMKGYFWNTDKTTSTSYTK